ncbi:hypothetical protein EDB92DRAFT_2114370 [Lactarius akahatsu]|uniref:Uncharacterized protein n=1 Tax=Lactarius akahatsu TaxID=416441 RepID=A0AAD4LHX1_9AGAM|nr:hypothetical protein EDB92DRAFT_2114370 [Lactarius akahatsu]
MTSFGPAIRACYYANSLSEQTQFGREVVPISTFACLPDSPHQPDGKLDPSAFNIRWFDLALVNPQRSERSNPAPTLITLNVVLTRLFTQLFTLKRHAELVWDPEMFDITILNAGRDPVSGTISYPPTPDETGHGRPVERVVNTAIDRLTIHCHTRNIPPRDCVLVRHLKEVVGFVKGLGRCDHRER